MIEVVPPQPTWFGNSNASNIGMYGVFKGLNEHPIVRRYNRPKYLTTCLVLWSDPTGDCDINNIELAAHYTQLCLIAPHSYALSTISLGCNNFTTVSWVCRGYISRQSFSASILRSTSLLLRDRHLYWRISLLPRIHNGMADYTSHLWQLTDASLLHHFSYYSPQVIFWCLSSLLRAKLHWITTIMSAKICHTGCHSPVSERTRPPG